MASQLEEPSGEKACSEERDIGDTCSVCVMCVCVVCAYVCVEAYTQCSYMHSCMIVCSVCLSVLFSIVYYNILKVVSVYSEDNNLAATSGENRCTVSLLSTVLLYVCVRAVSCVACACMCSVCLSCAHQ